RDEPPLRLLPHRLTFGRLPLGVSRRMVEMDHITLDEAAADLERLIEQAAHGNAFVITRDGRPLVKVTPVDKPEAASVERRFGFLAGQFTIPENFDRMAEGEIERLFSGA
ncbi:type II toxin-antitoxin system prevent-host-death family antitoxin, partial [Methylobacterium durans]|uniref:type II toxin-antitoxin system Phd/YefM family antitoxin n=1 Tax=Methylobacterium durans TaxID=2202825 RepID=UPI002B003DC5